MIRKWGWLFSIILHQFYRNIKNDIILHSKIYILYFWVIGERAGSWSDLRQIFQKCEIFASMSNSYEIFVLNILCYVYLNNSWHVFSFLVENWQKKKKCPKFVGHLLRDVMMETNELYVIFLTAVNTKETISFHAFPSSQLKVRHYVTIPHTVWSHN